MQELRRQHDVAVLAALAVFDPDDHAAAVDVANTCAHPVCRAAVRRGMSEKLTLSERPAACFREEIGCAEAAESQSGSGTARPLGTGSIPLRHFQ